MKQKVALALGSGGARGTAHIGVIRELLNQGYEISSISGTSMGALVGGVFASGKLDELEYWLSSLKKMDVFNLIDFTLSSNGIIKANKIFKEMCKFAPDQKIEDLPIKFVAVATDIKKRKEVLINEGSLFEAIRASISIPIVFTPVIKNDSLFVDGGVLNPVPVNRVFRNKGDILIAVNVNSQILHQRKNSNNNKNNNQSNQFKFSLENLKKNTGYINLVNESTSIMLSQITKLTLEMNPPDILIQVSKHSCGTFDFHKANDLIEEGRRATIEALEKKQ